MTRSRPFVTVAVALSLAAAASADLVSYCPSSADSICFAVGIPPSTASAGSGDIYFSITAPDTYQWVAFGTGSRMMGSNIFLMYQDGSGNVTLSPRLGEGHSMPTLDTSSTAADLTLLSGSGVADGVMTAQVRCSNCETWGDGYSMSVTSTDSSWIAGWKTGAALNTADLDASISEHDGYAAYTIDLTTATLSSDSDPFAESSSTGGSTNSSTSTSTGTGSSSGSAVSSSGGPPSSVILVAHAAILGLVMVVLYPVGSALMPLLGKWATHGLWQSISFLLMWAGFGLGVVAAQQRNMIFADFNYHTTIGTVVVAAFGVQPVLGYMHHQHFVQHQSRGLVSHVHIWWGRMLMVLGIVNGGLGLQLADAPRSSIILYSVFAGVIFVGYVLAKLTGVFFLSTRRQRQGLPHQNLSGRDNTELIEAHPVRTWSRSQAQSQSQRKMAASHTSSHSNEHSSPPSIQDVPLPTRVSRN